MGATVPGTHCPLVWIPSTYRLHASRCLCQYHIKSSAKLFLGAEAQMYHNGSAYNSEDFVANGITCANFSFSLFPHIEQKLEV